MPVDTTQVVDYNVPTFLRYTVKSSGAVGMKTERKLPLKDAWVIWFVLGVVMLNYPFLHIFNKDILIFGFPLTVLYFYIGWPVSIVIIYFFSVYLGKLSEEESSESLQDDTPRGGET